jgi:8-oxo-dGTP diphosphatase
MKDTPRHSVSVTAIVTRDDGRVLVIQREDDGRWVPPGGVLELAETPQECCVREVLEETGYRVEVGELTGVYKNMKLGVLSLAFRCALVGGEARTSKESAAVCWRTLEEVQHDVPEARAVRVFDALHTAHGVPVPVRVHDGSRLIGSMSP